MKTGLSLLACLLFTSCAATQTSHVLVGRSWPATAPDQVHIYLEDPAAPYEEIALVHTDSQFDGKLTDKGHRQAVINRLRGEAAKLGANGLILRRYTRDNVGGVTAFGPSWSWSTPLGIIVGEAIAIHVQAQPPKPASTSTHLDAKPL